MLLETILRKKPLTFHLRLYYNSPRHNVLVVYIYLFFMEEFPSGQREQTVNLPSTTSMVRIHPLPPKPPKWVAFYFFGSSILGICRRRQDDRCGD